MGLAEAQSIRRGTALLDRLYPEWFIAIDTESLEMSDPDQCVLGQLETWMYGEVNSYIEPYDRMVDRIGFGGGSSEAIDMGFYSDNGDEAYAELESKWIRAIKRRVAKFKERRDA